MTGNIANKAEFEIESEKSLDGQFPAKIRCNTWVESKRVQILLAERAGCKWANGIAAPWQPKSKKLLVILRGINGLFFSWATPADFLKAEYPEFNASDLLSKFSTTQAAPAGL